MGVLEPAMTQSEKVVVSVKIQSLKTQRMTGALVALETHWKVSWMAPQKARAQAQTGRVERAMTLKLEHRTRGWTHSWKRPEVLGTASPTTVKALVTLKVGQMAGWEQPRRMAARSKSEMVEQSCQDQEENRHRLDMLRSRWPKEQYRRDSDRWRDPASSRKCRPRRKTPIDRPK